MPLAQAINSAFSAPESSEQQREELAVLEGHDADIPTEVQGSWGVEGVHTAEVQETSSELPEAAPLTALATASPPNTSDPSHATHDSSINAQQEAASSNHDLAPSTIPQWVPSSNPEVRRSTASEVEPSTRSSAAEAKPSTRDHPDKATPASSELNKEIDLEAADHGSSSGEKEPEATTKQVDPNIVDWNGPNDPQNPINWSEKRKWGNVAVIASITFLTCVYSQSPMISRLTNNTIRPLASSMFAPGVPEVMTEFKSDNEQLASFVVSIYILGYAFGPLAVAPLSELYGRLPVYHVCNVLFVIFTIACALASNLNMLIGFRFLEGLFGSCPLTIGGGTIADMIVQQKRGGVMAIWALGPLMGPVIGPVAGGYLSQAKGWRWVFWVIAMAVRKPCSPRSAIMLILPGWRDYHLGNDIPSRDLSSGPP